MLSNLQRPHCSNAAAVQTLGTIGRVNLKTRRHLAGIRYAVTVALSAGEAVPRVGDVFEIGDMAVVRVVALRPESPRQAENAGDAERSMTVEVLETIRRLPNIF
jgi:hypothetical protein